MATGEGKKPSGSLPPMPAPGPQRPAPAGAFEAMDRMGVGYVSSLPPTRTKGKKPRAPLAAHMRGARTLLTMARLADQRDHGSPARVERLRAYGTLMAHWLLERMPELFPPWARDPDLLGTAVAVQNVGNVSIPPGVLGRAGRLNRAERDMVRHHPAYGAALVDAYLQEHPDSALLRTARDAVAFHHEAYDGSGYPHGLSGDDIPMVAQMAGVVDAFEALTSHRSHRRAFRARDASGYILQGAGSRFGPVAVEAFAAQQESLAWMLMQLGDGLVDVVAAPSIPPSGVEQPVDQDDPDARVGRVMRVLRDAALARSGGEVVVSSVDGIGRVYMHRGRVAWAHASDLKVVLTQWLVETQKVPLETVRKAMEECKKTGRNFGETLIGWGLIPRARFQDLLRQYVAERLRRIMGYPDPQVMFVPMNRTYATELTFSLEELLA